MRRHRLGASLALKQCLGLFQNFFLPQHNLRWIHAIHLADFVDRLHPTHRFKSDCRLELRCRYISLLQLANYAFTLCPFDVAAVSPDSCEEPVQSFEVFTTDLERMADWLVRLGVTTVAIESTGVSWVPVFEILEDRGMEVILANARHAKAVPGRKTDVNDAQRLQRLHS